MEEHQISMTELLSNEGFDTIEDLLMEYADSGTVPAMCSCGAQVEPDGHCSDGNPSVYLFLGMI